ncbi:MAG: threonine synthase [Spirochaetales bacterium]|nr:threonine synthase [Spirochaetales bacterium]MBQ2259628.1 threonine synthase [Spirochaetales bacterium]
MKFVSTRNRCGEEYSASDAILKGLAPDGGLFVPKTMPTISPDFTVDKGLSYAMYTAIKPFFEGDELEGELEEICRNAFNFPLPFYRQDNAKEVMELIYGPTSAFKDYGARFLAFTMEKLLQKRGEELTILVATSGDTGGAVASAFHQRNNLKVKVLFPKGRVADRQRAQLTTWGDNVESYEVEGSFDDCQKMVKDAFMDPELKGLSSANSINLGRLLPQMAYYVYASYLFLLKYGKKPVFIIPSGNVGNCTGAYWAKAMGAPIERIVLAVNENKTIPEYLDSGEYIPRPSVKTLANAMDVGAPSNMERLFDLFASYDEFKKNVSAWSVSDDEIRATIKTVYDETGYILCPHTACGEKVRRDHFESEPTIIVSTAHPAKFETIVEPLIGKTLPIPENLYNITQKESQAKEIDTDYHKIF